MGIRRRGVLVAAPLVAALLGHLPDVPAVQAQSSAGASAGGIVLQGRVLADDGSSTPLPGARVSVVSGGGVVMPPVASDVEGRFAVRAPALAGWSLRVTKAGFAPVDVVAGAPADPLTIRLAPGAVITGRVVDARGEPAPGVSVHTWPDPCPDACQTPAPLSVLAASARTTMTDDLGEYRIGSLPAGVHEVWVGGALSAIAAARRASSAARPEPDEKVRLAPGDAIALSHVTTSEVPVRTGARPGVIDRTGGSIRGRILDAAGRPIAEASVHADEVDTSAARIGRLDADGRYEVSGLPAGRFHVTVRRSGQPPVQFGQRHASQQGTPIAIRAHETLDGVDIVLPRAGIITGRVADVYGEPMEGVHVRAWERRFAGGRVMLAPAGAAVSRTDDRGRYRVHGLLPGAYYVVASDGSMVPRSETSVIAQGGGGASAMLPELLLLEALNDSAPRDAPSVFHPAGASAADAVPVRIEPGLDGHGVDITFAPPAPARVWGIVRDSAGQPSEGTVTLVVSERSGAPVMPARRATIGVGGSDSVDQRGGAGTGFATLAGPRRSDVSADAGAGPASWRRAGGVPHGLPLGSVRTVAWSTRTVCRTLR